ncbi:MAG TPA: hypothetical protein VK164_02155 [Flavobacterium sp.]|jgi:hypothetical protein|uniref:4Fe-4S ferredoxin-type domain-containing protein n=1 Tax=Flavobacterium lacisediminis TaxID=2989705 RepID=A0ABT3EIB8_9FLAO|nr:MULTISPECIES: hypothetical protein [Flavobacterium]MCW1148327.1 hypothetical protein [Flavobacterium lacisediminis]HLO72715.1 hypothetical protein [Flavobacterium sp.]
MKKYHIILIVLLGMFLMPSTAMACGNSNSKHSCEKEVSSTKKEKKSCCDNDNSKDKDHKGCEGNCGHSKCGCSSTCPSASVSFLSDTIFKNYTFSYSSIEKVKFSYTAPSISDGFHSIWLIPKIG